MRKNFFLNLSLIFLFLALLVMSIQFLNTRSIKLQWSTQEAYLMRFQWLDSTNLYLKTGKILMIPESSRLEDASTGEDQGYPFILSVIGHTLRLHEVTFGYFIKFNYILLITLGVLSSTLLFLSFKSILVALFFYILYLKQGIYNGGLDHHWTTGAFLAFYLSFLIFFLKKGKTFNPVWFTIYFLVAGIANIIREGNGVIAVLILLFLIAVLAVQNSSKKYIPKFILIPSFSYFNKNILLVGVLILIYISPVFVINGVRRHRDLNYFNGQTSNMITHHGIWHNAFMGLGYIPNKYGIKWDDSNPITFASRVDPNVKYMTNDYYGILRGLYFKYSLESPDLWLGNFFAKVQKVHELSGTLSSQIPKNPLPNVVNKYLLYLLLLTIFISSKNNKTNRAIFWLILVSLLISTIPGIIALPMVFYLSGFQIAFFITWFYFISSMYLFFKDFVVRNFTSNSFIDSL